MITKGWPRPRGKSLRDHEIAYPQAGSCWFVSLWKSAMTLFITVSWRPVNGFQNVTVTGFPLYWAGAPPLLAPELVPPQALAQRDGRSVVFVVDDGRVAQRPVTAAQDIGALKLVSDGLKAGERVVTSEALSADAAASAASNGAK